MHARSTRTLLALLSCVLAGSAWAATSSSYSLQGAGLDPAGGGSASSQYSIQSCIGTPVVGSSGSTSYALQAGCPVLASVSIAGAVNGVCGTPAASVFAPVSADLCQSGTPSAVTAGNPWRWSCSGQNGGSTQACSSDNATTTTGSGAAWAQLGGVSGWVVDPANTGFVSISPPAPPGYSFPHGHFKVRLTQGPAGSSATVTITYPTPLPANTVYWKYGPTAGNPTPHWYIFDHAVINGNTVTLTLTDGANGDTDLLANAIITDPGGPGVPDASAMGIPALSEWALILLVSLLTLTVYTKRRSWRLVSHRS